MGKESKGSFLRVYFWETEFYSLWRIFINDAIISIIREKKSQKFDVT